MISGKHRNDCAVSFLVDQHRTEAVTNEAGAFFPPSEPELSSSGSHRLSKQDDSANGLLLMTDSPPAWVLIKNSSFPSLCLQW